MNPMHGGKRMVVEVDVIRVWSGFETRREWPVVGCAQDWGLRFPLRRDQSEVGEVCRKTPARAELWKYVPGSSTRVVAGSGSTPRSEEQHGHRFSLAGKGTVL